MLRLWSLRGVVSIVGLFLLAPRWVDGETIKISTIGIAPVVETRKFWPFASYLARQLQSEGVDQGKVVVAESLSAMSRLLQSRQADIYIDSFFPALAVSRLSGSKLLLRRWKARTGEYRSVLFTQKDSAIARLEDLKGKIVGFESRFSSSGYFFPKIAMAERGLRLVPKRQESDPVKADEVGYLFTYSDAKTILQVLNRALAAGATDDEKYLTTVKNLDALKLVHQTELFPRQLVSYRADLPAKLVARVKEILLNMHLTDDGSQTLQAFENTARFDEIPANDLAAANGLMKQIDAELKLQAQR